MKTSLDEQTLTQRECGRKFCYMEIQDSLSEPRTTEQELNISLSETSFSRGHHSARVFDPAIF
ncbi:hypothetical protein Lalb_Chr20g0118551 [Lupinus albus]|uniref:Uncharacterized protein n=1 Tax=Lupinus albus TaxID=3870 RepID=A0A6A4NY36_LUPAL|nr:hypothetical protein Lalb_Chr20g0118551 [Lupinus albus]